ncbi:MAG: class I SAM-dependent methyltransferase [Pseudomonadales bacterium]|nr:class I SAM-dependent methyltransferase [Pseudomonadales bacterium]
MTDPKDNVARFFDGDAADYLRHQYGEDLDSFMAVRRETVARMLGRHCAALLVQGCTVVDAGCGPGILIDVLSRYPVHYSGVDIAAGMIDLAHERLAAVANPGFSGSLQLGDVEQLSFESGRFDIAASLGVIEYLNGDERLLGELVRVTRPGGFIVVAVTNEAAYNLWLEGGIDWMRNHKTSSRVVSHVKRAMGRGEFKQRDFVLRRHDCLQFERYAVSLGLRVIDSAYFYMNLLPYPLNVLCGRGLNKWANELHERTSSERIKRRGEGFVLLLGKPAA